MLRILTLDKSDLELQDHDAVIVEKLIDVVKDLHFHNAVKLLNHTRCLIGNRAVESLNVPVSSLPNVGINRSKR